MENKFQAFQTMPRDDTRSRRGFKRKPDRKNSIPKAGEIKLEMLDLKPKPEEIQQTFRNPSPSPVVLFGEAIKQQITKPQIRPKDKKLEMIKQFVYQQPNKVKNEFFHNQRFDIGLDTITEQATSE